MLPTEVICKHCGRDATVAPFSQAMCCSPCRNNPQNFREPKPHSKNTCECGAYKSENAGSCAPCGHKGRSLRMREAVKEFDVVAEREKLRAFLQGLGFPGDTVPTT